MRELRVIGIEPDGSHVLCEHVGSGEKFRVPADDRLRAAARGDAARLGQVEIEIESTLRPRDIQAKIRYGATVAQVAAAAGVSIDRVERFAHPVLLERQRAAELAALAHPLRDDGPALDNLGDIVGVSLGARGHRPDQAIWDAWKGDDNRWIVQVQWRVGRSQVYAHWRYLPGSNGGIVEPLDEFAEEIIDPDLSRPLRGLATITSLPQADIPPHPELDFDSHSEAVTVAADELMGAQRARRIRDTRARPADVMTDDGPANASAGVGPVNTGPTGGASDVDSVDPNNIEAEPAPRARKRKGSRTPSVPAWEDVLLGVRSNPNS